MRYETPILVVLEIETNGYVATSPSAIDNDIGVGGDGDI